VRLTARADYALRAAAELAVAAHEGRPVKGERIATLQSIPLKFLEGILAQLRRAGIVRSQRGAEGGYWLARPASEVSLAQVIRAVEGPLATMRGTRPEDLDYHGSAKPLQQVWIALRANERAILDAVTLAHVATNQLPERVEQLVEDPAAWT
jgi:Rrf2 family protein